MKKGGKNKNRTSLGIFNDFFYTYLSFFTSFCIRLIRSLWEKSLVTTEIGDGILSVRNGMFISSMVYSQSVILGISVWLDYFLTAHSYVILQTVCSFNADLTLRMKQTSRGLGILIVVYFFDSIVMFFGK